MTSSTHFAGRRLATRLAVVLGSFLLATTGFALDIVNDIHRVATFNNNQAYLSGTAELHITGTGDPLSNSTVYLNSPDAWLFFDNLKPSQVAATFLARVRVNNASTKMCGWCNMRGVLW
jgi:hypothetical protein